MNEHSIAVVIPTYNRLHTLKRAIQSVLSQQRPPDEIIVVDDGSTDGTQTWLSTLDSGIRVITQQNRGVSAARNVGIAAARSQWLALLDSDDEWLPAKLERQLQSVDSSTQLCHTDEIWIRNGVRVNPHKKHKKRGGFIFSYCLPMCAISPSSVLMRKSLFDAVGLFDESLPACEDYDLWLRICSQYPVVYVDEPLLKKYGGHDDQLSRKHWGMDRFRVKALQMLIDDGELDEVQRAQVPDVLNVKLEILIQGAEKRQNLEFVEIWQQQLQKNFPS